MPTERPKCVDCKWYAGEPQGGHGTNDTRGQCHRNAPMVYTGSTVRNPRFHWPSVQPDDWCGEFAPCQPA